MSAPASPTRKGLYINSFRISATDTSPYTNLLGTDGLGTNPAGGNKIDDLITYMVNEGYTYGIFYGLDGTAFVNSSSDEVFTATGKSRLSNIINRFFTAGLECSAVVNLASLNRTVSRWDGTSQVRKIVDYNNSAAIGETFSCITVETEFWNFNHTSPLTSPSKIEVTSGRTMAENLWLGPPDPATCGNTTVPTISLSPSVSSHDYVKIINSGGAFVYREIVNRSTSSAPLFSIEFDRPLPTAFPDGSCVYYRTVLAQDAPDYQTFKYRATNCRTYLNANDTTGMEFELYAGFPDYVNDGNNQLANLYGYGTNPVFNRILLTNYHRIPNWDYVNGGTQNRVTQDILPNIDTPRTIGFIVSAESPTLNARGCDDPVANFSGYFLEGRSLNSFPTVPLNSLFRPSNAATGGTEITNTNYCGGNCCAPNTVFEPTLGTYDPRTLEDCWDYTLTAAPTGAGYCPPNGDTYNEDVTSGAVSPVLDARANWDTIVVFTQSLIRQLNPPAAAFTFTATAIQSPCQGTDGNIQITITGGTGPYDIDVDSVNVATNVTSPHTLYGYYGSYSIEVFDDLGNPADNNPLVVFVDSGTTVIDGSYDSAYNLNYCNPNLVCVELFDPIESSSGSNVYVKVVSDPVGTYDSGWVLWNPAHYNLCEAGITVPANGLAYTILAQSAEGCTLSIPIGPFASTNPLGITFTGILPVCYSGNDSTGSIININITGPGGFDPTGFTMTVSGPVTQTAPYTPGMAFFGLPVGTYTLTATGPSGSGCGAVQTPIELYPAAKDPLTVTITKQVDPVCSYICNGSAEVLAAGGKPPYIYSWSNGQIGPEASGLCPTTYTVTVLDDNKCTASLTIDLSGSSTPIEFTYRLYNIPVGQTTGGAIYIDSVTGAGGAPYTYSWVGPNGFTATTDDITDLEAGTYTVTICSEGGGLNTGECCLTQSFVIGQQCIDFTLEELKVILFKAQCCAGYLAKEYVQYQEIGRPDLAECKLVDLKYLTLAINALSCINELPDSCLSCEDISNIVNQIKKLCDCDCCDDAATATYNVTYNSVTGQLDSNSSIN